MAVSSVSELGSLAHKRDERLPGKSAQPSRFFETSLSFIARDTLPSSESS
jgi:hypothetical protein